MLDKIKIIRGDSKAQCDARQVEELLALGWSRAGAAIAPSVPVAKPATGVTLQDIVDDRALAGLEEIGIATIEAFLDANISDLRAVKYITDASLAKSLKRAQEVI